MALSGRFAPRATVYFVSGQWQLTVFLSCWVMAFSKYDMHETGCSCNWPEIKKTDNFHYRRFVFVWLYSILLFLYLLIATSPF